MRCPVCNTEGAELVMDEVDMDLGVGNQHITGVRCPKCGELAACDRCGKFGGDHASWCRLYEEDHVAG